MEENKELMEMENNEDMEYTEESGNGGAYLVGGTLIGAGLTALGIWAYNKFKNRKKKDKSEDSPKVIHLYDNDVSDVEDDETEEE